MAVETTQTTSSHQTGLPRADIDGFPQPNPFSTRFTTPGAVDWIGDNLTSHVDRLEQFGYRSSIVGPHGVGKSTMLSAICEELCRRGLKVQSIPLAAGMRSLPCPLQPWAQVVMVDGFEQLSLWRRWALLLGCRRRKQGLVVTVHRPWSLLPTLVELEPQWTIFQRVVETLLASSDPHRLSDDDVRAAWDECGGNMREGLFDLYDRWEG